jgi:nucleoside-diphosphate-sugar epimerase
MTILLTGAAGFIAEHFVAQRSYFLNRNVELIGVDKTPQPPANLDTSSYLCLDLSSVKEVIDLFKRVQPTTVVHLAGVSRVGEKADENVEIAHNLLEASTFLAEWPHFICAGSAAEYGDLPLDAEPCTEQALLDPIDPYARSKVECWKCFNAGDCENGDLKRLQALMARYRCSWMRFANVYGPGQDPEKLYHFVPSVIDAVYHGKPVVLNSKGKPQRQFVYVSDITRALWLAVTNRKFGVFNLGGIELSMEKVAYIIVTAVHDYQLRQGMMPIPAQFDLRSEGGGAMRVAVDSTKANIELGWSPLVGIYDGLRRTVVSRLHKELQREKRSAFIA